MLWLIHKNRASLWICKLLCYHGTYWWGVALLYHSLANLVTFTVQTWRSPQHHAAARSCGTRRWKSFFWESRVCCRLMKRKPWSLHSKRHTNRFAQSVMCILEIWSQPKQKSLKQRDDCKWWYVAASSPSGLNFQPSLPRVLPLRVSTLLLLKLLIVADICCKDSVLVIACCWAIDTSCRLLT